MQYRLIESFSNSTDPLFPLPATDNQIPVTRIPGKFEKDEKLRGTIPEFSEASENAKKEKVIPSWLKCTSRGKKITEEIGSIEKWGKIGLKFSDIIPDRRNKNSKLFIQYFREIKFHLDAWKRDCERSITILRYLILSYLIFAPRKQEIRPIERKIDQIVTKFDNGNSLSRRMGDPERERYTWLKKMRFFPWHGYFHFHFTTVSSSLVPQTFSISCSK